ncbi:unnamed protein product [Durusdinium trenchii]|uniref:Phospholipid-transporting ATPase n=1 Tax=Durusdinium trenchii TaxID=1381693 RepID=A0ABP0NLS3_9DINO
MRVSSRLGAIGFLESSGRMLRGYSQSGWGKQSEAEGVGEMHSAAATLCHHRSAFVGPGRGQSEHPEGPCGSGGAAEVHPQLQGTHRAGQRHAGSLGCQAFAASRHRLEEHLVGLGLGGLYGSGVSHGHELERSESQVPQHRKSHQPLHAGGGGCSMPHGAHQRYSLPGDEATILELVVLVPCRGGPVHLAARIYWLLADLLCALFQPDAHLFVFHHGGKEPDAQAYFIKNDLQMYDEVQDTPANARTTNLCHELGQVSYVFSDKTGTLTQNVMELKRISIGGEIYGETGEESGFQGRAAMLNARLKNPSQAAAIDAVLEVLAVSHTVVSTKDRSGRMKYEAESPDEGALVEAVGRLGWVFTGRTNEGLTVEVNIGETTGSQTYELLALNAFTSARKRQSVLVRRPSGEVVLLVKGADDVMQKLAADPQSFPEEHLRAFAKQGLRTLVMGRRWISEAELRQWHQEYTKAQTSMQDREGALAQVADQIERSLETLGITGIEDKLQVGVEDAIVKIRQAGIKLWVLTGDKLETAKNIGFSTRVLSSSMEILTLDLTDRRAFKDHLEAVKASAEQASNNGVTVALIVTGHALEEILRREKSEANGSERSMGKKSQPKGKYQDLFLEVAVRCSVVIACRVSPLQKAEVVTVVRKGVKPTPVTLAIGDGANDVPMLQEAQVGVGISGREGRQAVNCADFAISQFRYLARLMLVHGRWNYRRACKFVIYSFWKNAVLVRSLAFMVVWSCRTGCMVMCG